MPAHLPARVAGTGVALDVCCSDGHREGLSIGEILEVTVSSRHSSRRRRIEELQERLESGDTLLVTELSRLGRSTGQVILLINQMVDFGVNVYVIKQNLRLGEGAARYDSQSIMVTLLALFAEIERDFISSRTKEALAAKKAQGITLGKPKGTIQSSMYDKDKERIKELLGSWCSPKTNF